MTYMITPQYELNTVGICRKAVSWVVETCLQTTITPSEKHWERNQMVPGWPPRPWATLEPFGFSHGVSQRELRELEGRLPQLKIQPSSKTRQIQHIWEEKLSDHRHSNICLVLEEGCILSCVNPPSSSRNSLWETQGEKPEGSRVARCRVGYPGFR
jgi:hypothetical protein